ncbi:Cytochrome P450 89A9 [Acorus gramineus]|uniref:Cytochrome P450 89A9 n=1 Tax=Acorus gramineus TaxID=55184 RepID=A0AAV9B8J6_ACOGR|nr:Cytochrome P450 89A9 [Acorus gramineus]
MENWLLITFSIILSTTLIYLLSLLTKKKPKLPPGPPSFPIVGSLFWLRMSLLDMEHMLRRLRSKYGPILTIRAGSRPFIIISDRDLAHKALVNHGAAFADRPPALEPVRILNSNQHSISSAHYGPLWRLLRRNLTSEILHPSRVRSYGRARKWVLGVLAEDLKNQARERGDGVCVVIESFRYAMFCLLALMCYGEGLGEGVIRDIEKAQQELLLFTGKLNVFAFMRIMPRLTKLIFKKRWEKLIEIRRRQEEVLLPLIRARKEQKMAIEMPGSDDNGVFTYVDSLLELTLPEEGGRGLNEGEMVSLCSEFLNAGTDTTSTALQWIMANVVKYQRVQEKILEEVRSVVGGEAEEVKEEDLHRMPYVKAVVLEGLRRHPPGHFVLPHTVSEEVCIEGHVIPKNARVNFMVAEMGLDEKVWEEPMEFKPERFLSGGEVAGAVDITGSREITMMPFGVGRRICPGLGLALLHLEYFVANLVMEFEWKAVEDEEIDLSEKVEFTWVMKNPLKAKIVQRAH